MSAMADDGYLDDVAVYRRMHGDRGVRVTRAEAVEVVRRMVAAGVAKGEIARRTGLNPWRLIRESGT